jgi:PAS domain S-box-containing protein
VLVFAGYYLGAQLGLALTFQPHPVSVMWPPNSILLGALLLNPARVWWFLLLCAFPAHLITESQGGVPLRMILCWFVSNSSEALIGAATTRWLTGSGNRFDSMRGLATLFFCGGVLGPFFSSFLDSGFVTLNHWGQQPYWEVWRMRFCSNVFTSLVFAPVIVMWGKKRLGSKPIAYPGKYAEAALIGLGLLGAGYTAFWRQQAGPATIPALLYAPLPFLLWTAIRFGPPATSLAILLVALTAIWGAVHGRGPFASHIPEQNALDIQVFFFVVSVTFMVLSVSTRERIRARERFVTAFRRNPDAMIISRRSDGHIIEVNDRWETMFCYSRPETIGQTMMDLNIYGSDAEREKLLASMSPGMLLHGLELCLRLRTGELRNTIISANTEEIGGEPCLLITVRDITDSKRAEEAQRDLAHASRLALVGELTAMIAHEVNQPLGAILSNAEAAEMLLEQDTPPLDEVRRILSDIRKNDLRADEAIRRIRGLLRKREMQIQRLDLGETIRDVVRLATGDALQKRIVIKTELSPACPRSQATESTSNRSC